jgi:hypothetical protein
VSDDRNFHVLVIGWELFLVEALWDEISRRSGLRFSFLMHPRDIGADFAATRRADLRFFRDELRETFPEPDFALLASLEGEGIRTIHNMILGDSIVAALPRPDAFRYATFLARRVIQVFEELRPSAVIGSFDSLHSGIAQAVARRMGIPWFVMNFSVIPAGLVSFVNRMTPAHRVQVHEPDEAALRELAETTFQNFHHGRIAAPAYVTPAGASLGQSLAQLPRRALAALKILRNARDREFLKYTQHVTDVSLGAVFRHFGYLARARSAIDTVNLLREPPRTPYLLFGLHTQPESSIDVWAPFYSDQYWAVETLSRSMPPDHKLLVKVHKSDAVRYTRRDLERLAALPGVELVHPFADVRRFVDQAAMIVSIQGTMGLEGGLLGKPVIMLGDSPVVMFPSAARVGEIDDLPKLIRDMLARPRPSRDEIVTAFVNYLRPFMPARHNDWTQPQTEAGLAGLAAAFGHLSRHVEASR